MMLLNARTATSQERVAHLSCLNHMFRGVLHPLCYNLFDRPSDPQARVHGAWHVFNETLFHRIRLTDARGNHVKVILLGDTAWPYTA